MAAAELNNTVLKNSSALKAYYRFESGALTTDSSGNSHTLTNNNTVAEGTGVFGGSADLESSSSQYFSIANHADFNFGAGDFAFGGWFKRESVNSYGGLVAKIAADDSDGYSLVFQNNNVFNFVVDNYTIALNIGTNTSTEWQHVVVTRLSGFIRVYLDSKYITGVSSSINVDSTEPLHLGTMRSSAANYYDGMMDDWFFIKGSGLSADQIKELYEGRYLGELRPNQFGTTQALYHLSSTTDTGGNNYHLTNNGSVAFTAGKFGNAADFGSSKSLTGAFNFGATFSFNFWVKRASETAGEEALFYVVSNGVSTWNMLNYRKNGSSYEIGIGVHVPSVYLNHTWAALPAGMGASWHMITYIRTGNDSYVYYDGNYLSTRNYAWSGTASANFNMGTSFQDGGGQLYWAGQIDEFLVTSTALTANQIRTIYALGVGKYY